MSLKQVYAGFGRLDLYKKREKWVKLNFSRIKKMDNGYYLKGDRRLRLLRADVEIYKRLRQTKRPISLTDEDGGNMSTGLGHEAEADDGLEL